MTKPRTPRGGPKPPGSGRRPVDPQTRERIVELGRIGAPTWTRNAIAKEVGVSPSTVSRICAAADPPVTFDRSATAAATEARQADLKDLRGDLSRALLDDVAKIRERFWAPMARSHVAFGEVTRWESPADPSELRNLAIAAGVLIDKHIALVRIDSGDRDLSAVDLWLGAMLGRTEPVAA